MSILDINNRIQSANEQVRIASEWNRQNYDIMINRPTYQYYKFLNQHGMNSYVHKVPRNIAHDLFIDCFIYDIIEMSEVEKKMNKWFEVYDCKPYGLIMYNIHQDQKEKIMSVCYNLLQFDINGQSIKLPSHIHLCNVDQWPEWMYKDGKWQFPFSELFIVTDKCAEYTRDEKHFPNIEL